MMLSNPLGFGYWLMINTPPSLCIHTRAQRLVVEFQINAISQRIPDMTVKVHYHSTSHAPWLCMRACVRERKPT